MESEIVPRALFWYAVRDTTAYETCRDGQSALKVQKYRKTFNDIVRIRRSKRHCHKYLRRI